jgi:ABC-type glycerol-3-phosphate transport system permease component
MKRPLWREILLHSALGVFVVLTLAPFFFVLNNSFRTNIEMQRSFFGFPASLKALVRAEVARVRGDDTLVSVQDASGAVREYPPAEAAREAAKAATRGYSYAWKVLRKYMLNSFFVCGVTAFCVVFLGSLSAYVLSRYKFPGSRFVFYFIICTMMFPGVLTLVPSFLLVKRLGLLNSYWALILPAVAGGQVFATFVFKSFFDGLPEDLFEAARLDGAGHVQIYSNIVIPLSKSVISVVLIMNVLGTWNNLLWPFIVNTDERYHVVTSGLYVLARSAEAANQSTLYAAYTLASIPLLVLFVYATKPFMEGVTSGAFKA